MGRKDLLGVAIIGAIVVIASGAFYARSALLSNRPQLDDETLCLIGKELTAHTAIIVDRTDPLTKEQTGRLMDLIGRLRRRLVEYEAFSMFLVTGDQISIAEPYFGLCAPPQGDQANPWIENPRKIRQAYELRFGEPLKRKMDELQKGTVANSSPIISTIGAVMRRTDMSDKVGRRQIFIVSDLLENTKGFTHYKVGGAGATFDDFRRTPLYTASQRTRLEGVRLELLYIQRERDAVFQGPHHRIFWVKWFQDRGAPDVSWREW